VEDSAICGSSLSVLMSQRVGSKGSVVLGLLVCEAACLSEPSPAREAHRVCLVDGRQVFGVTSCGGGVSATSKIGVEGGTSVYETCMCSRHGLPWQLSALAGGQ
jgi:hypothetical protein